MISSTRAKTVSNSGPASLSPTSLNSALPLLPTLAGEPPSTPFQHLLSILYTDLILLPLLALRNRHVQPHRRRRRACRPPKETQSPAAQLRRMQAAKDQMVSPKPRSLS